MRTITCPRCHLVQDEPKAYDREQDGIKCAVLLCPACLTFMAVPEPGVLPPEKTQDA
jgi:hypothetical protein